MKPNLMTACEELYVTGGVSIPAASGTLSVEPNGAGWLVMLIDGDTVETGWVCDANDVAMIRWFSFGAQVTLSEQQRIEIRSKLETAIVGATRAGLRAEIPRLPWWKVAA